MCLFVNCIDFQLISLSQLIVEATKDFAIGGTQTATATVVITVQRNMNGPIFSEDTYMRTVQETLKLGSSVVQLSADDADDQVTGCHDLISINFIFVNLCSDASFNCRMFPIPKWR